MLRSANVDLTVVTKYFPSYLYYFHYLPECNDVNVSIQFQKLKDSVEFLCYYTPLLCHHYHHHLAILFPLLLKKRYSPSTPTFVIIIAIVQGGT